MGRMKLVGNAIMLGERRVGFLSRDYDDPDKVWYVSPRESEKHYFVIWKGWGIALEIVEFLEAHDVHGVKLVIDAKRVITSSLPNLRQHGHVEQYQNFERQVIMAEKHWLHDGQAML